MLIDADTDVEVETAVGAGVGTAVEAAAKVREVVEPVEAVELSEEAESGCDDEDDEDDRDDAEAEAGGMQGSGMAGAATLTATLADAGVDAGTGTLADAAVDVRFEEILGFTVAASWLSVAAIGVRAGISAWAGIFFSGMSVSGIFFAASKPGEAVARALMPLTSSLRYLPYRCGMVGAEMGIMRESA